jgi:hypothetical protein
MTIQSGLPPVWLGAAPDTSHVFASIKPLRYRYVMAYLHDERDAAGVVHKAGEVMSVMPMTEVSYGVGFYSGTEFSGSVYLPGMTLDLMPTPPFYDYARIPHPDKQGLPLGAMFECGNRAIYVMRNEEVVWGGILWTRSYSSGSATLAITALSFDGYAYYRALHKSVVFLAKTSPYVIWWSILTGMMCDFTNTDASSGQTPDGVRQISTLAAQYVPWTGITSTHFNADKQNWVHTWPNNIPKIEMPPLSLGTTWAEGSSKYATTVPDTFRGYNMSMVGEALQTWADTNTLISPTSGMTRCEYRVVCWFDSVQQIFRQRYVFGEMSYTPGLGPSTPNPTPNAILSPLIGANTHAMVESVDNKIIFDFPGHISDWTLTESMEQAATRVITISSEEDASKHVGWSVQDDLLGVPGVGSLPAGTPVASNGYVGKWGWPLYDRVVTYDTTSPGDLQSRATTIRQNSHVPQAAQINDIDSANTSGQRTSYRSTELNASLYVDPTTPFPDWHLGDWATFAIEDPFYGGKMYLQRRIIGYQVQVVPDHETDFSNEAITLELTDETKIDEGS